MSDASADSRFYDGLMNMFFLPEMRRRQEQGSLPKPLKLWAAQVVLYPDRRPNTVRFNAEVKCRVLFMKSDRTRAWNDGDPIYVRDIAGIEDVELTDEDDPGCAHATVLCLNNKTWVHFDFRFNKNLARRHIDVARQFHAAAVLSWHESYRAPCLDNLYSAAELAIKADLLTAHDPRIKRASHSEIGKRFRLMSAGNYAPGHQAAFNKLTKMRYPMRYLRGQSLATDGEVSELVRVVESLINHIALRIGASPLRGAHPATTSDPNT
jgi:hypothetical protein